MRRWDAPWLTLLPHPRLHERAGLRGLPLAGPSARCLPAPRLLLAGLAPTLADQASRLAPIRVGERGRRRCGSLAGARRIGMTTGMDPDMVSGMLDMCTA